MQSTASIKDEINISVKELEPCLRQMTYTFPSQTIDKERERVVKEFSIHAQIPGFRKGKAPASLIRNKYRSMIDEDLIKRLISAAMEKSSENEMDVVSYSFADKEAPKIEKDKDFSFSVNFDLAPEFEIPEYKGIEIEIPEVKIDEENIEKRLEYYRDLYAEFKTSESAAEKGDMLKIDFSSDLELPEDASPIIRRQAEGKENWVWLNDPENIPGITAALSGAETGKEYDFESEYPADYREKELAGKKVKYHVKVLEIQKKVPLESDDALAEKMGFKSADELKEKLTGSAMEEEKLKNREKNRQVLVDKLCSMVEDFPVPPNVLASETQTELRNIARKEVKGDEDVARFKEKEAEHRKEAETSAKEKLKKLFVLRKIARAENITVEDREVDSQIKGLSSYMGYNEKNMRQMIENSGRMDDIQRDIMMSKVTDFLMENAKTGEDAKEDEKAE